MALNPVELLSYTPEERLTCVRMTSTEEIVTLLVELGELKLRTRNYGKKYRIKQQVLSKVAAQYLDKDELEAVRRRAQEVVDGLR